MKNEYIFTKSSKHCHHCQNQKDGLLEESKVDNTGQVLLKAEMVLLEVCLLHGPEGEGTHCAQQHQTCLQI